MNTDRLVETLKDIGFTEYESQAYLAAVSLGTARFSELVDESDVPQQRIYDVVGELEDKGVVEVHERSGVKEVVAPSPEVALADLKDRQIDQLSQQIDTAVEGLEETFNRVEPSEGFVTVLDHESSARRHMQSAIEGAEWWLTLSITLETYADLHDDIEDAIDRGVSARLLVQTDDRQALEDWTFPDGLSVRYRPSADRLITADREYGIFHGIASAVVSRPYLITRDQNLVVMFQRYVEQFWAGSETIRTRDRFPRRYLNPWHAIVDLRADLDAGTEFEATVDGIDTETGQEGTWEGRIVEYELQSAGETDPSVVLPYVVSLTLEDDGSTYTIGGWDATLEDVAAYGLEIDRC